MADLVGFRLPGQDNLMQAAAVAGSKAYLAYITKEESPDIQGFLFNTDTDLNRTGLHLNAARPNDTVLKELGKRKAAPVAQLSCGIQMSPRVYLQTWPRTSDTVLYPILVLNKERKTVSIKFYVPMESTFYLRKLEFKLKDLHSSLIHIHPGSAYDVLYIPLVRSPSTHFSTAGEKQKYWYCNGVKDPWTLAAGCLYQGCDMTWELLAPLTVLRIQLDRKVRASQEILQAFRELNIFSKESFPIRVETVANIRPIITLQDLSNAQLSFHVLYMLLCLLSHGYATIFHLPSDFLARLRALPPQKAVNALRATFLTAKKNSAHPHEFLAHFETHLLTSIESESDSSEDMQVLCRVMITPSTLYFTLPTKEISNRVTRHYSQHLDRFLRVSLVDERFSSLSSLSPSVRLRLEGRFLPHFKLLERDYELLSFSSSQLRAGSFWMFANLPDLTAPGIRGWLGDFSKLKIPAKYAARVGQCFSNSKATVTLTSEELCPIEEVKCGDYVMSDGAGTLSTELSWAVAMECSWILEFGQSVQIRLGGIKGVVSVDPKLEGRKLCYRPSMYKFPSSHMEIEVLNCAEFRYGYLNRQIILLLSTLGVPDQAFIDLQNNFLTSMRKVFTEPAALQAGLAVANKDEAGASEMIDVIRAMIEKDYSPATDPFLAEVAQALYNRAIMELRQRQRVLVPESACLMGVLDETGVLEYGETYIHIKMENSKEVEERDITGPVAVTKNPCFHPGDVRLLTAVNERTLRRRGAHLSFDHHVNVVVFPQKGPRAHPNEISGSDLDGDLYFVTWDETLLPSEMYPPMDYSPSGKSMEGEGEITSEKLKDFFFKFVSTDNLGKIANAHLAVADYSVDKALNKDCLALAQLHSIAVDFAKTETSVEIPPDIKPKRYPDFMENKNKESYESTKVIGLLYRQAKNYKPEEQELRQWSDPEPAPACRQLAEHLHAHYETAVSKVMNIFNIASEAEVLSGEIAKFSKFYSNNQKRREETRAKLKVLVSDLIRTMRVHFNEVAGSKQQELAQECLHLAYSQGHWLGFPWVTAGHVLLERPTSTHNSQ